MVCGAWPSWPAMSLTDHPAWLSVMIFWARSRGSIGVDHARERCLAGASWSSRGGGVGLLGRPGPVDLGVVVDGDGGEQLAGDLFGAVGDCADRGGADQV